jgi:diguanylate cyclase (GGDEF)-like protein
MLSFGMSAPLALDPMTIVISGTCITGLLGLLLLSAWAQERIQALAWWGAAYLLGGFSVAVWSIESVISPPLPYGTANSLLFLACGMIWSAARIFHGLRVLWVPMFAGAAIWLASYSIPDIAQTTAARIVLGSLIVSSYTFLTATELWRERRKTVLRRWPAIFVPILHGAVFLVPIPLASLLPAERGLVTLAGSWISVFALEVMLYAIGTAFTVLVLAKERSLRVQRDAALTDELTGVLNRRGFFAAMQRMLSQISRSGGPVSVLMFDLDHFKTINDRFGHRVGDEVLKLFAAITRSTLRSSDVFGRFVAMLPCAIGDAGIAAERVRSAFAGVAGLIAGYAVEATVSVGAASSPYRADVVALLGAADQALYRAKQNGRNRVERMEGHFPAILTPNASGREHGIADRHVEVQTVSA